MIRIHRSKPVAQIGPRAVRLSRADHLLLTALGMMDNRVASRELLIQTALDDPAVPSGDNIIRLRIARLRRKLGTDRIRSRRALGYILDGAVCFYDEAS